MSAVSRRGLLSGAAAAGAALSIRTTAAAATAAPSSAERGPKIGPDDPRYGDLVMRGTNRRFVGKPDYVRVIRSTEDAVNAVQETVRGNKRIAVPGGGHCFEDFVDNSAVEVVLDLSQYAEVGFDQQYRAFSIGAGATLEGVYKAGFVRTPRSFFDFYDRHNTGDSPYAGLRPRTRSTSVGPGPCSAISTGRPAVCRGRTRSTRARTSTTRTSPSPIRSGTPRASRGTSYQGNYPRLQRIKAKWDPRNVFRHRLSIQPASNGWGAGPDPRGTGPTPQRQCDSFCIACERVSM
jgi:hypothetical protein